MIRAALIAVLLVLALVFSGAIYVVNEREQVIITQFGEPVGEPITTPGLKFKVPFIQKVHRFDKRFLEWDGDPNELPTRDKRFIWVDTYARWRITDPLKYFQRLFNERGAQTRLDDILDGETRNVIASHNLVEVVRLSNREPLEDESQPEATGTLEEIARGREQIRREILAKAQARTGDLGIEILDVQFKRINYTEAVRHTVYERMIAERKRIAARFRSEGQGEANRILGEMERDLKEIESEAYRQAQEIVGAADAEATEIYARAYDRSGDSRQFYQFLKTLETLESTVDEETTLVLGTDGEMYRFIENSR